MKQRTWRFVWILAWVVAVCGGVQADPSGDVLELVQQECNEIEDTILSGDLTNGLVVSGSALYQHRNSAAFQDIASAVCDAFAGLRPEEANSFLVYLQAEETGPTSGLGWFVAGLLARAAMKPASAAASFEQALKDQECCRIPTTYAFLGQTLTEVGDATGATRAFQNAISAASEHEDLLFYVRCLQAETLRQRGQMTPWREVIRQCSESGQSQAKAWGLEQEAEDAWRRGDSAAFAQKIGVAAVAAVSCSTSEEIDSLWEKTQWKVLNRHLAYGAAYLEGATENGIVFDYETALLEVYEGTLEAALERLEPWVERYPIAGIDGWSEELRFWGQRTHLFYNNLLGRLGRTEEALRGFQSMLSYARDTDRMKFEPHVYGQIGYCLAAAGRPEEAARAYETALAVLDTPGEVVDPTVAYNRQGRIHKKTRMNLVANYRGLLNRLNEEEGHQ